MIQFVIEMEKNLLGVKVERSIMTSGHELSLQFGRLSNKRATSSFSL